MAEARGVKSKHEHKLGFPSLLLTKEKTSMIDGGLLGELKGSNENREV